MQGQMRSISNNHQRNGRSSKKAKKRTDLEKPKQPQRGLGVAQLERIRMQMGYGYGFGPAPPPPPPHHHHHHHRAVPFANHVLNQDEMRMQSVAYAPRMQFLSSTNSLIPYPSSQSSSSSYIYPPNTMVVECHQWSPTFSTMCTSQQSIMRPKPLLAGTYVEVLDTTRQKSNFIEGMGSSLSLSQNYSNPTDSTGQELDLELRL